jgi:hypothetical protein
MKAASTTAKASTNSMVNSAVDVRDQLFLHRYADTYDLARFGLLSGDPLGSAGVEHVEREAAAAEDFVVEGADVELGA